MALVRDIPRRARASRTAARPRRPPLPASSPTAHQRRGDGPADQALYRCACGHDFHADVTASVGCPRCGGLQEW